MRESAATFDDDHIIYIIIAYIMPCHAMHNRFFFFFFFWLKKIKRPMIPILYSVSGVSE